MEPNETLSAFGLGSAVRPVNNESVNNITVTYKTVEHNNELIELKCTFTKTFELVSLAVTIFVIVGTVLGNALILLSLNKFRNQFKGNLYMLIANLAIADIFLALGLTLHFVAYILPSYKLDARPTFCLVKMGFTIVSLLNSGLTLMFMSLDRFCAIAYPMHHFLRHRDRRRVLCVIIGIWIFSLVCGFLPTAASVKYMKIFNITCAYGHHDPRELTLFTVGILLLQILFNAVLCCLVLWKLRRTLKSATKSKQKSMKSKSMLLIIVYLFFVLCWLPFIVLTVLLETNISTEVRQIVQCYREYALFIGMINSTMNWIIYGLVNSRFRKAFTQVLYCKHFQDNRSSVQT